MTIFYFSFFILFEKSYLYLIRCVTASYTQLQTVAISQSVVMESSKK